MTEMSELLEDARLAELRERLERAVARVCPPWLAARAEDLAHAALGELLDRDGSVLAERDTATLYRAAHAVVVDEIRELRRRRADTPGPTLQPSPGERESDAARSIADCLGEMEAERARAVLLYLLGHTVPEVGALLGLDTKTAEQRVHGGVAEVRAWLRSRSIAP